VRGTGATGVVGTSIDGTGVRGTVFNPGTRGGHFFAAADNAIGAHAEVGVSFGSDPDPQGSIALLAEAPSGNLAARFIGDTEFAGDVTVAGVISQSITPAGGGAPVQSHAIQALQPMIEHVGEVSMAGLATLRVDLPTPFLAVADTSAYFVQVTGIGGDNPQVSSKDANGFNLKAQNASKAPDSVCFRVVAPRL
jgi:hypothetical protein